MADMVKRWASDRQNCRFATAMLKTIVEELGCEDDNETQSIVTDIENVIRRLDQYDARSISRQVPPKDIQYP